MAKSAKFLVATDNRYPLTMALAHAFAENEFPPELLTVRKQELVELVSEAAKTFGFQSRTTLTSAFDMSVGLLSLALVSGSNGEARPAPWARRLRSTSWKTLVKEAISLVRDIKERDVAYDYLFEADRDARPLRDHLRDFVLARDRHQQWSGYQAFVRYRDERRHLQGLDAVILWLIKSQMKKPLFWMKDPIEGPTCAEEALNTLLFRASSGLGFGQKDIILGEKEFRHVRSQYENDPESWLDLGQKRFESLTLSIPVELADILDKKWFRKTLGKGPPKVRKWESDDLVGITGLYYYQTYL